jgi:hypothetical protein
LQVVEPRGSLGGPWVPSLSAQPLYLPRWPQCQARCGTVIWKALGSHALFLRGQGKRQEFEKKIEEKENVLHICIRILFTHEKGFAPWMHLNNMLCDIQARHRGKMPPMLVSHYILCSGLGHSALGHSPLAQFCPPC